MYMRIVRPNVHPGKAAELARRWQEAMAPRLQALPGFKHAHFGGDTQTDSMAGVSVWEDRAGLEAMSQAMREFSAQVQDIATGPPAVEDFEILAEA